MSKSMGNYEPLTDMLDRHDPQAIRLLLLQTSYANVKNFTEESVAAAAAALRQLKRAYRQLHALGPPVTTDLTQTGYVSRIERELDDDMNTAAALAVGARVCRQRRRDCQARRLRRDLVRIRVLADAARNWNPVRPG